MEPVYIYEKVPTDLEENGESLIDWKDVPEITRIINQMYSFYGNYAMKGQNRKMIKKGNWVKALWTDGTWQYFKIITVYKTLQSVSFNATHLGYEANRNFIQLAYTARGNGKQIMANLKNNLAFKQPFEYLSDVETMHQFTAKEVNPISAIIGQNEGNQNLAGVTGCELDMDNYKLILKKRIGEDRGFRIDLGVNLESIKETVDDQSVVNSLYLVGGVPDDKVYDDEQPPVLYKYLEVKGVTDETRQIAKRENSECKTEADLKKWGQTLFDNDRIHEPKVTHEINMIALENTVEYKKLYGEIAKVNFGDTVHCDIDYMGVTNIAERMIECVFLPTLGKYKSTVLGNDLGMYTDQIQTQVTEAKKDLQQAAADLSDSVIQASQMITGNSGGHVIQHPKNEPSDFAIMDTNDVTTAKHVLRMNKSGIGFSKTGWEGPFLTAWTIDGVFNANFIRTGILEGILIRSVNSNKTGKIELNNGHLDFFDFSTGEFYGRVTPSSSSDGGGISIVMEKGKYFSLHDGYGTPILEIPHNSNQQKPLLTTLGTHTHKGDLHIEGKLFLNGKEITGNGSGGGGGGIGGGYPPEVTSKADKFAWDLWTYLLSKGYSKAAAAGILGNVQQETGHTMDPDTLQGSVGPGYGLVQWDGSAYPLVGSPTSDGIQYVKNLMQAANITDGHSSILGQSKLIDWCMYNGQWLGIVDPTSVDGFKNMTDPRQAANTFERNFERPAVAHPERQGWAQEWHDKFKDLKPSTELGKVGLQRLESLVMQRHGNGQCYAVPAEYSGVLGGCGLGAGTAYPLSHNIGDTEAAAEIGSGYDWAAVGWKVIFNPSYDQLVTGAIINWKRGGNIGGFNVDYEFGHTGVIRGLANGGFQTYEQNIGLGQVVGKYERSWVGPSEISSIVIPPK